MCLIQAFLFKKKDINAYWILLFNWLKTEKTQMDCSKIFKQSILN